VTGLYFVEGEPDGTSSHVVFRGPPDLVNLALAYLRFKPASDFFGEAAVTISIQDLGFSGANSSGTSLTSSITVPVVVEPVNDAPTITLPIHEDGRSRFVVREENTVRIVGARYKGFDATDVRPAWRTGFELFRSEGLRPDESWGSWGQGDVSWRHNMVRDISVGIDNSNPKFFAVMGDNLYFQASDKADAGEELWKTDGTRGGTVLVKDIQTGKKGSFPSYMKLFDGALFFAADGLDLTWMVQSHLADECGGKLVTEFNPSIHFFQADENVWDPTRVYDCPNGYHWASTAEAEELFTLRTVQDLYFATELIFDKCGWTGYEWRGQERRKYRFADSHLTGSYKEAKTKEPEIIGYDDPDALDLDYFAGSVCVVHDPAATCYGGEKGSCFLRSGNELWTSDGSDLGTYRVVDVEPGSGDSDPQYFTVFDELLYFTAFTTVNGVELMRTDGTASGTTIVEDVSPGAEGSVPKYLTVAPSVGSFHRNGLNIFMQANGGYYGNELWVSDGVPTTDNNDGREFRGSGAGTYLALDIWPGPDGSEPQHFCAGTNGVLFQANDGANGAELWTSDGTEVGTVMVKDINPGTRGSSPRYLVLYNGIVYFQANDGYHGEELWKTDGTEIGTVMVMDVLPGSISASPQFLTLFGGSIFFAASHRGSHGYDMWKTDGTQAGTTRAFTQTQMDLDLDVNSTKEAWPFAFATYQDSLYYSGNMGNRRSCVGVLQECNEADSEVTSIGLEQAAVVEDVDIADLMLTVELRCERGHLFLDMDDNLSQRVSIIDGGLKEDHITFQGRQLDVNLALRKVFYTGKHNDYGFDEIVMVVNDTAADGSVNSVSKAIEVVVNAVNDAPTIVAPASIVARVGRAGVSIKGVTFDDVDARDTFMMDSFGIRQSAPVEIKLSTVYGRLTLSNLKGVAFEKGDGFEDSLIVMYGTLDDLNLAVEELRYACDPERSQCNVGTDVVTLVINDKGYSGEGGPLATTVSVTVTVIE